MADPPLLRFLPGGAVVPCGAGETILSAAVRAGIPLLSPCGGEGRCGKCRVTVDGETRGGDDPGTLSPDDLKAGIRLACRCVPVSGTVTATILPESRPAVLSAYLDGKEAAEDGPFLPLHAVPSRGIPLGLAVDLGTSTLAGALVDLGNGAVIGRAAADNPQMACGEDLISRIVFGEERTDGFSILRGLLQRGVESVISALLASSGASGEIVEAAAAGNTVISHIFHGISPAPVRRPPFRPVVKDYPAKPGIDLGIASAGSARWRLFPSIGGFVGGDIVAGILAAGMHREEEVTLLFDVGTNGEVVLGNREFRIACSSSAGPAFEGGEVACGMRAFPGAIDSVRIDPRTLASWRTTIGGGKPAGLCGSGILDLCAELFRNGLVDRAGRFVPRPGPCFRDTPRGPAYVVVPGEESATGSAIVFSAPDLKSVLRTKAALCAAADALMAVVGLRREDVARVFIAGGFGNFLDLRSAMTLGLFPPFPLGKFVPLGNASLAGAIGALRNRKRWEEAAAVAAGTSHHDLSSDDGFMELYQRSLFIPHTDEETYRRCLTPEAAR